MTSLPWPSIAPSPPRARLVLALSTVALLLWAPATSFAADGGRQTEQGRSSKTALFSAGLLSRGAGYGTEHGSVAVRRLQLRLRRLGHRPGPIDGLFGPLTQGAVLRFQSAHGLVRDGVVGPRTKKVLAARPVAREGTRSGSDRPERVARERRAPDRPPTAEAPPSLLPAPDIVATPRVPAAPLRSDGLAPEIAAGLGALATALVLTGAWMLASRRRGRTTARSGAEGERSPASGLRLGMVCAALLAVFAIGAAAGALFASHATPGDSEPKAASVDAILQSQSAP